MTTIAMNWDAKKKFWGRDLGKQFREKIIGYMASTSDNLFKLDFTGVEIVDFSYASEVVAVLIARLSVELEGYHIVLSDMNRYVEENVNIALEKAELCALVVEEYIRWKLIGKCSEPLRNTFAAIVELKKTDSPTLAARFETTVPVINNRLKALSMLGIIGKEESTAPSGGKQFIYHSII